jgi:hypothetical protein
MHPKCIFVRTKKALAEPIGFDCCHFSAVKTIEKKKENKGLRKHEMLQQPATPMLVHANQLLLSRIQ